MSGVDVVVGFESEATSSVVGVDARVLGRSGKDDEYALENIRGFRWPKDATGCDTE
jgi:hypothetical protein